MVYRARDIRTGEVVAIKKIERSLVDDYVEQECLNLARCQHNQIIQFFEVCRINTVPSQSLGTI